MVRFWSMAVDDANTDSQQILKETPHRHKNRTNVNDIGGTLIQSMLKNVHDNFETLEEVLVDVVVVEKTVPRQNPWEVCVCEPALARGHKFCCVVYI